MNLSSSPSATARSSFVRKMLGDSAGKPKCSQHQWLMEEPLSCVQSLSVFGARGDRYSIVVLHHDGIPHGKPGYGVEWCLRRNHDDGRVERVLFVLQWTMDMSGSGCVAMCGREMPVFRVVSA